MTSELTRFKFGVIYAFLMLTSISIGIMISLLPIVARKAHISDVLIISAQAITAGSWIPVAGAWARMARRRGRKFVILIGGVGLSLGCLFTGGAIWAAVSGLVAPLTALAMLIAARAMNGAVGLAAVPAAQALVIERTLVSRRAIVVSSLASAQALGSIIGPAAAPLLIHIPALGLAGPLIIVAALCTLILPLLATILPTDAPDMAGMIDAGASGTGLENIWRMKAVRGYLIYSALLAVAAAGLVQTIGFLVLDTIHGPAEQAQFWVGQIISMGAAATLIVQLIVTPIWKPAPRLMILAAPIAAMFGLSILVVLPGLGLIAVGIIIANVGFALGRPGLAAAASLALPLGRQTELAAAILSTGMMGVVIGPVLAVGLYSLWRPLPFILLALIQTVAFCIALRCGKSRAEEPGGKTR